MSEPEQLEPTTSDAQQADSTPSSATTSTAPITLVIRGKDVLTQKPITTKLTDIAPMEPLNYVKLMLNDYIEFCAIQHYQFAFDTERNATPQLLNEFKDIASIAQEFYETVLNASIPLNGAPIEVPLLLVPESFDAKKARLHVKRVRDIVLNPPTILAVPSEIISQPSVDNTKQSQKSVEYPGLNFFLSTDEPKLGKFYDESLNRLADSQGSTSIRLPVVNDILSKTILNIALSEWNPPPSSRQLQGDLLYVVVAAAVEGTFHVTATANGFFVNRSTTTHYDSHANGNGIIFATLIECLFSISSSFKKAWIEYSSLLNKVHVAEQQNFAKRSGPLESVARVFEAGKGDSVCPLQWNAYQNQKLNVHTKDSWRLIADLSDNFGAGEDKGPQREWNDEYQSICELPGPSIIEKVTKARLLFRTTSEFVECCRLAVVGICNGHVSPLNPMDPVKNQVYVYNNIFFSQAVDAQETFKLSNGEVAARKLAGHDIKNQRLLQTLGIPSLSNVMSVLVDFRGRRFVAQSIVPGILSGGGGARLMYGTLEIGKRISSKTETFPIVEEIGKALRFGKRQVPIVPISSLSSSTELRTTEDNSIKVDELDETADENASCVTHVGPLEGKLLKGTDGRFYALEMVRLTPRDANFVVSSENSQDSQLGKGTGLISEEKLKKMDQSIFSTYVLRSELIKMYLQQKVIEKRQAVLSEKIQAETKAKDEKQPSDEAPKEKVDEAKEEEQLKELQEKLAAISLESIALDFSPNAFLRHPESNDVLSSDVNQAVALRDEEIARELSTFLYKFVLPYFTSEVRQGEVSILDGDSLIETMHARGINARYLGSLAELAQQEEAEDNKMSAEGKQRVQLMPVFWLELLEIEMIARAFRRVINLRFGQDLQSAAAPAKTIASALNHVFGSGTVSSQNEEASKNVDGDHGLDKANDGKKKKKSKSKTNPTELGSSTAMTTASVTPNAALSRDDFLRDLLNSVEVQFAYKLSLASVETASFLNVARIPRVTLLRRVCMLLNLRITSKDYNFESSPFVADDILSISPRIKSATGLDGKSDIPVLSDAQTLLATSRRFLSQGQLGAAFEVAQEASSWLQDCVGPIHRDYRLALDELVSICLAAGEYEQALPSATKNLTISVQIDGLDSVQTLKQHIKLATVNLGLVSQLKEALDAVLAQKPDKADKSGEEYSKLLVEFEEQKRNIQDAMIECKHGVINHLLASRYLTELIGGPRHPELISIFLKLGAFLAEEEGQFQTGLLCLQTQVKLRLTDLKLFPDVTAMIAELCFKRGFLQHAVEEQQQAYLVGKQLFGDDDARTSDLKSRLEAYLKAFEEKNSKQRSHEVLQNSVEQALVNSNQGMQKKLSNLVKDKAPPTKTDTAQVAPKPALKDEELFKIFERDQKKKVPGAGKKSKK